MNVLVSRNLVLEISLFEQQKLAVTIALVCKRKLFSLTQQVETNLPDQCYALKCFSKSHFISNIQNKILLSVR